MRKIPNTAVIDATADDDLRHFADRLTLIRVAHGKKIGQPHLDRQGMAKMLGIERARYYRYERGEVQPPFMVLRAIRQVTGASLNDLICDDPVLDIEAAKQRLEAAQSGYGPQMSDRIRWVRELWEPNIVAAARAFNVTVEQMRLWEFGSTPMPVDKIEEFCWRFSVTVSFLVTGSLTGLSQIVEFHLLRAHPELSYSPRRPSVETEKTALSDNDHVEHLALRSAGTDGCVPQNRS